MKVTVTYSPDEWRHKRWMVRYYRDRRPIRSFFKSKEEADQNARSLRDSLKKGADESDISEALRMAAGTGYKIASLVKAGLDYIRSTHSVGANPLTTFAEGAAMAFAKSVAHRACTKTLIGYKSSFRLLNARWGPSVAATITEMEVDDYLKSLPGRDGKRGSAKPDTRKSALMLMRMALRAAGVLNPLPNLSVVKDEEEEHEVRFFSNDQIVKMLGAASDSERGLLCLAIFVAIRPETLEKLPASSICVADQTIKIPAHLSKDRRAHFLETIKIGETSGLIGGVPAMVWQWLEKYPFVPRRWASMQRRLKRALEGYWIPDGLRHTGATNYRTLYGYHATADLLTHCGLSLLREHYTGLTTRAEALKFYEILPGSVSLPSSGTIKASKRVDWPSDIKLAEMLASEPAERLGAKLGCSGAAISKRCRLRGIPKPGRGYWARAAALVTKDPPQEDGVGHAMPSST